MMAGTHHMEQVGFSDTQHFELQPLATVAASEEECSSPDPETECTTKNDMPGDMEQDLQNIYNNYSALQEMIDIEGPVVLNPEVLMCGTNLHPEPQLTFSTDGCKIQYLDSYSGQDGDLLTLFWDVSDIISIHCKWMQMVQYALITVHVRSSPETVNSGPVKVEFCLADPQWEWKQQKIWQLDSRYQKVWKNIKLDDFASQNWSTEPSLCFPKQYFHGIDDFEDVIYPKGDRDAVSVSTRDVGVLLPEVFLNDTIIDFYIKYLTQRIEPTERHRYHFFSSFFFRKLADLDKDQENAPKGREAFLHVRKWTRKIDIFAKEFLFIPVNFSLHWSLLVICYPGEVDTFEDGDARIAGKLPCIMHMNSIKGTHSGLKDIIQSYLWEEWKERHPESESDSADKFLNLRFLSLELPQQDNLFDCGLFLLHYVERFLMDAPSFFNPMKIDVVSSFLGDDWFVPAEASLKRSLIRKLIHELVTEPSKTFPKLVCGDEKHDEWYHGSENAVGESSREFLGQACFVAEPDSVCRIHGAHQQAKLSCLNDFEKGLSVPGCILQTGGVSVVAQREMQMCPSDDGIAVCSPSLNGKNEPFFAYSGNQLDPKSCVPEDAEEFKGSCSVVKDKDSHQESLLDIFDSNQKISSHAEVEVHDHDIMVLKGCPFSDNVNKVMACQGSRNEVESGCSEASQDMDSVMMLDASKHDNGTGQESTEGKADNGRCDLSEDTDSFATGGINKDVVEWLPGPAHILETGGVSLVAIEEMRVCPPNNDVAVCLPSQDAKNEQFLTCAQEVAEAVHGEPLLDFRNNKRKKSSEAEVEVHQHDIMDSKCFSFSNNADEVMACHEYTNEVENDRCGAPQDTDSVLMLDTNKHEIGPGRESSKGKADDGRHDLSEYTYSVAISGTKTDAAEHSYERNIVKAMDGICDLSEDARSVMIDDMNSGVAECLSGKSTVEAMDPGAVEDDTKAEKTSTTIGTINDSEQYVSSESKDGNRGNIMSSGSTASCRLKEGNVPGGSTNGTSETHADGEDACHNLAIGELAPSEDDTTFTDAEIPHVKVISTCTAKYGTYSEKGTSNARRPLLGSTSEDKSTLVSDDMCSLKDVSSEVKNEKCCVGAKRPFPDSNIREAKEAVPLDDRFWDEYSKRTEARFGRKYKRRIVWKRRKVISLAPPFSSESPDLFFSRVRRVRPRVP